VESTKGKLRLFHLPPYSPDLNPGELVWNHLKNHKLGREVIKGSGAHETEGALHTEEPSAHAGKDHLLLQGPQAALRPHLMS
jgi:hypothetical protein